MLAEHGADAFPPMSVFNHGVLRQDNGDPEGGRTLAEQACDAARDQERAACDQLLGR